MLFRSVLTLAGDALSWQAVPGAIGYAVVRNGSVVGFTTSTSYSIAELGGGSYSIRVANECGGLGAPSSVLTGIDAVLSTGSSSDSPAYNLAGQRVNASFKGIVVKKGKKFVKRH